MFSMYSVSGIGIYSENVSSQQQRLPEPFVPYAENGGTAVGIAGEDFAVIGADTRLSSGFAIHTRGQKKLFKLSKRTVLGASGCWCDALTLTKLLQTRLKMYEHDNDKVMATPAIAQMTSTVLYYKRFFPYNVGTILAGLDGEGKGCVYSFDPVGHCERSHYVARGSAMLQVQSLLDNQIGFNNMQNAQAGSINKSKALTVLKDAFTNAAERDVFTGDCVEILMITPNGIQEDKFELRKD